MAQDAGGAEAAARRAACHDELVQALADEVKRLSADIRHLVGTGEGGRRARDQAARLHDGLDVLRKALLFYAGLRLASLDDSPAGALLRFQIGDVTAAQARDLAEVNRRAAVVKGADRILARIADFRELLG